MNVAGKLDFLFLFSFMFYQFILFTISISSSMFSLLEILFKNAA